MKKVKRIDDEQKLEELLQKCEEKISTKNLGIIEQSIHDRGVSAGYFGIYVEDISELSNKSQILYLQGQIKGDKKRRQLLEKNSINKETYYESRKACLRNLGSLKARGLINTDTRVLNDGELKIFNEGYYVDKILMSERTLDDILEERNKSNKETADDALESKRVSKIRIQA